MRRSRLSRSLRGGIATVAFLACGCSFIGAHALTRSAVEDMTANDYVVSAAEAERVVLDAYRRLRIVSSRPSCPE